MGLSANQIIEARAPQFYTDPRLSVFLQIAQQRTATDVFGDNYGLAVALRTMHYFELEKLRGGSSSNSGSGAPGAVTSKSEGEISESRQGAMQKRYGDKWPDLCQTVYGIELIELIEGTILAPMTRIV